MAEKHSKYSLIGRLNFEDLYNAFLGLEQRQQMMWVIGMLFLLVVILVLPISCASKRLGRLEDDYSKSRKEVDNLIGKIRDYQSSKALLEKVKNMYKAGEGESLTTLIENLANEDGIGQNIEKLKPVNLESTDLYEELGVDANISKVTLEQIVNFLYRLENNARLPLVIKKLTIKPNYQNRQMLNVNLLQVATIKLKKEESAEKGKKE